MEKAREFAVVILCVLTHCHPALDAGSCAHATIPHRVRDDRSYDKPHPDGGLEGWQDKKPRPPLEHPSRPLASRVLRMRTLFNLPTRLSRPCGGNPWSDVEVSPMDPRNKSKDDACLNGMIVSPLRSFLRKQESKPSQQNRIPNQVWDERGSGDV